MLSNKRLLRFLFTISAMVFTLTNYHTSYAATITILNNDGPGEGFNDNTPFSPVGGNSATTRGQARLNAFQAAANLWAAALESEITIKIQAQFNPMGGTSNSAILGSAGPMTFVRDFPGAPLTGTWYPVALANALSSGDRNGSSAEIVANFNSDVDNSTVLGSIGWYYGLNGNPGSNIDLITVVLHELGHGLGFTHRISLSTGAFSGGFPDIYSRNLVYNNSGSNLQNLTSLSNSGRLTAIKSGTKLLWNGVNAISEASGKTGGLSVVGDRPQMYAPNPVKAGSSVAHFDITLAPNELMEPSYTGLNHNVDLTLAVFEDIGWSSSSSPTPTPTPPPSQVLCNGEVATIVGTDGDDVINGTDGPDIIHGLGGNDTIRGFKGDDLICGGDGNDILKGDNDNDVLLGEAGNDDLGGGDGNDTLKGGGGSDTLRGWNGNDNLDGGPGTDILIGDAGTDICSNGETETGCESSSSSPSPTPTPTATPTPPPAQEFCNGQVATIVGTPGDDVIDGTDGPDVIAGLEGNDTIRGFKGDDLICGGDGNDILKGDNGNDVLLGEAGNDDLGGGDGNDTITGGGGSDTLRGWNGNDNLDGGPGTDILIGDAGTDICSNGETATGCEFSSFSSFSSPPFTNHK